MAVGLAPAVANEILDAIGNNGATTILTALTQAFIRLHTADPGAAGATAIAGNATVKGPVSFGAAANGLMSNDTAITWTTSEVDTSEDYTHFTLWGEVGATTFIGSGLMTANAVVTNDEFTIPVGDLDLSFAVAA